MLTVDSVLSCEHNTVTQPVETLAVERCSSVFSCSTDTDAAFYPPLQEWLICMASRAFRACLPPHRQIHDGANVRGGQKEPDNTESRTWRHRDSGVNISRIIKASKERSVIRTPGRSAWSQLCWDTSDIWLTANSEIQIVITVHEGD